MAAFEDENRLGAARAFVAAVAGALLALAMSLAAYLLSGLIIVAIAVYVVSSPILIIGAALMLLRLPILQRRDARGLSQPQQR